MASTTEDKRLTNVESAKQEAINTANNTYNNMINQTDSQYNELINANKDYATKQQEIQQQNTDFAIEQINQNKEKAEKDYTKEQTGAFVDYQKATDQHGAQAEALASQGLTNSGFAQSTRMNAYVSYQNRYATAREVYNNAILSYDNAIKDAQLKNNAQLAEIAFQSLQTQLQYALEGFQYKNQLLQTKLQTQMQLDSEYNNRYQQVLSQINTENSLAEQIRQYNESMAYQKQRDAVQDSQWQQQFNLSKQSASRSSGSSSTKLVNGKKTTSEGSQKNVKNSNSSKLSDGSSSSGWISSREMANSLGLPAVVKLENVLSDKEYEKKVVDGIGYWRKK